MNIEVAFILSVSVSILAFLVALYFFFWVKRQPSSNKEIARVGQFIKAGANTFLKKEYMLLAIFAGVVAILIFLFLPHPIWSEATDSWTWQRNLAMMLSYLFGTVLSALAGKVGIAVATIANMKSAEAATKGIRPSFLAGFRGGAVIWAWQSSGRVCWVSIVYMISGQCQFCSGIFLWRIQLGTFRKSGRRYFYQDGGYQRRFGG